MAGLLKLFGPPFGRGIPEGHPIGAFFAIEAAHRTERFGNVATVWSTYDGRFAPDYEAPFIRGANTVDLVFDGGWWRILQILWQPETPDLPLPAEYLTTPEREASR